MPRRPLVDRIGANIMYSITNQHIVFTFICILNKLHEMHI